MPHHYFYHNNIRHVHKSMRRQKGFTLVELMVAMVIFAMLSLAGWQIMDSITKSRDRAKVHLDQLSELDYAYLQLSQDLAQTVNYVSVPVGLSNTTNSQTASDISQVGIKPSFTLNEQQVSFVRLAAPDPRYQQSPLVAKVNYLIQDGKLVKQRFYRLNDNAETPTTSVLLNGIKDAKWVALTPQSVPNFPDQATLDKLQQEKAGRSATATPPSSPLASATPPSQASSIDLEPYQQLPNGVEISFTYHDEPITWRFSLPKQAPVSTTEDNGQGQI